MSIVISTATEADIPALSALVNGAYRGEGSRKGWTTEADLLDGVRTDEAGLVAMLQNPAETILTYKDEDRLLGCVALERKGTELYLGMLTVWPEAQTAGIGKKMMAAAEKLAMEQQCHTLTITVITDRHELIAWYERRGFVATGEKKPFPDDPRFGLPKRRLEFIVMKKALVWPLNSGY